MDKPMRNTNLAERTKPPTITTAKTYTIPTDTHVEVVCDQLQAMSNTLTAMTSDLQQLCQYRQQYAPCLTPDQAETLQANMRGLDYETAHMQDVLDAFQTNILATPHVEVVETKPF